MVSKQNAASSPREASQQSRSTLALALAATTVSSPKVHKDFAAHQLRLGERGDGLPHLGLAGVAHAAGALGPAVVRAVLCQDSAELDSACCLHVVLQVLPLDLVGKVAHVHEVFAVHLLDLAAALALATFALAAAFPAEAALPADDVSGEIQVHAVRTDPVAGADL